MDEQSGACMVEMGRIRTRKCRQGGAKATGDGGTVTIFCLIFSSILTEENTHFPQEAKAIQMPSIM